MIFEHWIISYEYLFKPILEIDRAEEFYMSDGSSTTTDHTTDQKDDSLTITDNRTGKSYKLPIMYGTYPTYGAAIQSRDLQQIKVSEDDFGLMGYDPGFTNTASCQSAVTFIDGEKGILRYRGYPIEELAGAASFSTTLSVKGDPGTGTRSPLPSGSAHTWSWCAPAFCAT